MPPRPQIHLVTYATPAFRHRQWFLGASARANRVVDTVTAWNPRKLLDAGFEQRCPGILLSERGSGFWAWKPFIICKKLAEIPDGDIVFYCDVGRTYPFKLLAGSLAPYLSWMKANVQDILPGVEIPWLGPMSVWTKRDAFIAADLDTPEGHSAIPIQASFSLWRKGKAASELACTWLEMASQRNLISDDLSTSGIPELPDFHDHRHDQTLLSLVCINHGVKGIQLSTTKPACDTQHPTPVAELMEKKYSATPHSLGWLIRIAASPLEIAERILRSRMTIGHAVPHRNQNVTS